MRHPGRIWLALGALLVAVAVALAVYNVVDSERAGDMSARALAQIEAEAAGDSGSAAAGSSSVSASSSAGVSTRPLYEQFPELQMPAVEVDGYRYIGTLAIPSVGLELPVMQTWDEGRLKVAPCRYVGSVYQDNMVIAAHNYTAHFGKLFSVETGAEVLFTDVDGNEFAYRVAGVEIVDPYDIETMTSADGWDLTLFTCTYGGRTRYTVRCISINN